MITDMEKPIWFDYIELDENLNQRLSDDAPEDVKAAYEKNLEELEQMNRSGQFVDKA